MSDAPDTLHGLGPVTAARLAEIGITTATELRAVGAVDAWRRLRFRFGRHVTLNALYGLESAISGIHWRDIDATIKARLKRDAGVT